jgi:hypothetical protein
MKYNDITGFRNPGEEDSLKSLKCVTLLLVLFDIMVCNFCFHFYLARLYTFIRWTKRP